MGIHVSVNAAYLAHVQSCNVLCMYMYNHTCIFMYNRVLIYSTCTCIYNHVFDMWN